MCVSISYTDSCLNETLQWAICQVKMRNLHFRINKPLVGDELTDYGIGWELASSNKLLRDLQISKRPKNDIRSQCGSIMRKALTTNVLKAKHLLMHGRRKLKG